MRMRGEEPAEGLSYYQHDGAAAFRFVVAGSLRGPSVEDLEHAWTTASSVIQDKPLVFDLSALSSADPAGVALLHRLRAAGARLIAPASEDLREVLGLQAPEDSGFRTGWRDFGKRLLRI